MSPKIPKPQDPKSPAPQVQVSSLKPTAGGFQPFQRQQQGVAPSRAMLATELLRGGGGR